MKKVLLIMLLLLLSVCSCKGNNNDNNNNDNKKGGDERLNNLITNFWDSEIMYDETVILVGETDKDGNLTSLPKGNLLFECEKIIEVKQYFHQDNSGEQVFKEGVDFKVEGKTITLIGDIKENFEGIKCDIDTNVPFITDKQMTGEDVFPGMGSKTTGIPSTTSGLEIPYTEGYHIVQLQLSVTYEHKKTWNKTVPEHLGSKLPNVTKKLKNKEDVNLLIFGDSISTGSNSSSILNIHPYLQPWYELVKYGLETNYGSKVNLVNKSVGGWTSTQGVSPTPQTGWVGGKQISQVGLPTLLEDELKDYVPDIAIIGFGMNDATLGVTLNNYANNIMKMIDSILKRNPNCDIIVLGTMLANSTAKNQSKNQTDYNNLNVKIAEKYIGKANVVSLDMGLIHQDLLDSGKKYMDMTGNNVNHPNDFMARIYAMSILTTIGE